MLRFQRRAAGRGKTRGKSVEREEAKKKGRDRCRRVSARCGIRNMWRAGRVAARIKGSRRKHAGQVGVARRLGWKKTQRYRKARDAALARTVGTRAFRMCFPSLRVEGVGKVNGCVKVGGARGGWRRGHRAPHQQKERRRTSGQGKRKQGHRRVHAIIHHVPIHNVTPNASCTTLLLCASETDAVPSTPTSYFTPGPAKAKLAHHAPAS